MKIIVEKIPSFTQPMVGNVYSINGGYGRRSGHVMILLAITAHNNCLMLVIDRNGEPVGVTSYGLHAIEERAPIAFVPGLDSLTFIMEPLG